MYMQALGSGLDSCALNVNELRAALRLLAAIAQPSDAQGLRDLQRALKRGQLLVPSASGELAPLGACAHMHTAPTRLLNRCCCDPGTKPSAKTACCSHTWTTVSCISTEMEEARVHGPQSCQHNCMLHSWCVHWAALPLAARTALESLKQHQAPRHPDLQLTCRQ